MGYKPWPPPARRKPPPAPKANLIYEPHMKFSSLLKITGMIILFLAIIYLGFWLQIQFVEWVVRGM